MIARSADASPADFASGSSRQRHIDNPDIANFGKDRTVPVDFVFEIPAGQQAKLLGFKQNALTDLPPPVQSTEETEAILNNPEGATQEKAGQPPVTP